jgi:hypothetical protein
MTQEFIKIPLISLTNDRADVIVPMQCCMECTAEFAIDILYLIENTIYTTPQLN